MDDSRDLAGPIGTCQLGLEHIFFLKSLCPFHQADVGKVGRPIHYANTLNLPDRVMQSDQDCIGVTPHIVLPAYD
jgi:hypothetical protein